MLSTTTTVKINGPHAFGHGTSVNLHGFGQELITLWIQLIVWLLKNTPRLMFVYFFAT